MPALERLRLSQTARPVDTLLYWSKDSQLLLTPPYQRGDVWGPKRQRNLIRSILLGIPIPSIIINDRFSAAWNSSRETVPESDCIAVIDGKQRITAILAFLTDELAVPAEWFGCEGQSGLILFSNLPLPNQRGFRQTPLQMSEGQLPNIEAEIEVFELVNFGGLAQGESDFS